MAIGAPDRIMRGLHRKLQTQITISFDEIIEEAKQKLEDSLRQNLASIALETLAEYDVSRDGKNIVIQVRNDK